MNAGGSEEEIHQKSTERWIIETEFQVIYVVAFSNEHNAMMVFLIIQRSMK